MLTKFILVWCTVPAFKTAMFFPVFEPTVFKILTLLVEYDSRADYDFKVKNRLALNGSEK